MWLLSLIGPSTLQDLSHMTVMRLWVTGLQNINASDLLFSGSAATLIVTRGKRQTRQQGDVSGDVRSVIGQSIFSFPLRATKNTIKT